MYAFALRYVERVTCAWCVRRVVELGKRVERLLRALECQQCRIQARKALVAHRVWFGP